MVARNGTEVVGDTAVVEGILGCIEVGFAHLSEDERERLLNADPNLLKEVKESDE